MTTKVQLAFAKQSVDLFDVRHFSIREALNDLFEVTVTAISAHEDILFDTIVGQGAALYVNATSNRVWAGVCAQIVQLHGELPSDKKVGGAKSSSTYQITLVPTLWRTTLRKNSRIFQHLSTPDIVKKLLGEWHIQPDVSRLKGTYKPHEYCVQYGESDFAFISRLLEDAGISFYFDHKKTTGTGDQITKLVFDDAPHTGAVRAEPLALVAAHDLKFGVNTFACADVTLTQRMRPGKFAIRDFDFRRPLTTPILASATIDPTGNREEKLEQYHYVPGVFWFEGQAGGGTPQADDQAIARTDPKEGSAKITSSKDPSPVLINQEMEAERRRRLLVSFQTNATDLAPGIIVGINQKSTSTDDHPRKDLAPSKTLLIYESQLEGYANGEWSMVVNAVFSEFVYRPERRTPRPRIYGVQSAIVVGPKGKEIYTDEFGRVRVQFHWDREGKYDDKSSCWMRVSQAWAGNGFGMVTHPRVGHEVLVEFFEGDPDHPVVVGRVYNNTSYGGAQASGVPYKLPDDKTKTGIKTDSSSGGHGYNEMVFDDKKGSESIHFQAEKDLSYLVKDSESTNVGKSRSATIGGSDGIDIGKVRTIHVGKTYTIGVGTSHVTSVAKKTSIKMTDGVIEMSTGKASLTINGGNISLNASEGIIMRAAKGLELTSLGGKITMQGGPQVRFNDADNGQPIKVAPSVAADPPVGPALGLTSGPPFKPTGGGTIEKPLGIEDVSVNTPKEPDPPKVGAGDPVGAGPITASSTTHPLKGSLYGPSGGPLPTDVRQGGMGDCYLMSSMQSVARDDPSAIQNDIKTNADGTYTVTFHDPPTTAQVETPIKDPNFFQRMFGTTTTTETVPVPGATHDVTVNGIVPDNSSITNNGATWPNVMEQAYAQQYGGGKGYEGIGNGGYPSDALSRITGGATTNTPMTNTGFDALQKQAASGDFLVATTGTTQPPDPAIFSSHAYSVQNVYTDAQGNQMVDVFNPHNNEVPAEAGRVAQGTGKGGQFTMPYSAFAQNFNWVYQGQAAPPPVPHGASGSW